jgi:ArsR family transcriptional regulator
LNKEYNENATLFKALSDKNRLMIIDMLSCGELCACEILEKFSITQPTLSHHMKTLSDCGLVKERKAGKWTYYSLDEQTVKNFKDFLNTITSDKENCICNETKSCATVIKYSKGRDLIMSNLINNTGCGCNDDCLCDDTDAAAEPVTKNLLIEWRHLDVEGETCERCYDTGENLAAEVKRLNRALNPRGIEVKYIEIKLDESQVFESNGMLFNNIPIEDVLNIEVSQNYCGSCSDLLSKTTYCRTVKFDGNEYEDVPAKAIRQAAYKVLGIDLFTDSDSEKNSLCASCCSSGSSCC